MHGLRDFIVETRRDVARLPLFVRVGLWSAVVLGFAGAICGLLIGLAGYPPTAWAAALELGIPAAVLGAILGLVTGAIAQKVREGRPER